MIRSATMRSQALWLAYTRCSLTVCGSLHRYAHSTMMVRFFDVLLYIHGSFFPSHSHLFGFVHAVCLSLCMTRSLSLLPRMNYLARDICPFLAYGSLPFSALSSLVAYFSFFALSFRLVRSRLLLVYFRWLTHAFCRFRHRGSLLQFACSDMLSRSVFMLVQLW